VSVELAAIDLGILAIAWGAAAASAFLTYWGIFHLVLLWEQRRESTAPPP
jgi:hypothetical protein